MAPKAAAAPSKQAKDTKDASSRKKDEGTTKASGLHSKPKAGTGTEPKSSSQAVNGPAPSPSPAATTTTTTPVTYTQGVKPDQTAYNKEQDEFKKQIDELNAKISAVKEKIAHATKSGGPGEERRKQLKAELDELRSQQGDNKTSREKIISQLKAANETVAQKIKDLQAAKGKLPYKNVAEVDTQIKKLDSQIESGSMKVVEEKRAIQEIQNLKRQRRLVEGFQSQQDAIDAEKSKADALRNQLDDPELKALSDRYETIKTELDQLKQEGEEAYASRNDLYEERKTLQAELDVLWDKKKTSAKAYREAQDNYWAKVKEDREKKAEKMRAIRQAAEDEKKKELVDQLREDAAVPAYQSQIEDCQTLIDQLSGNTSTSAGALSAREGVAGVADLDLRKVDEAIDKNLVPVKKKGGDDENYFMSSKKAKGGQKGGPSKANGTLPPDPTPAAPTGNEKLKISLPLLSALASLSIPPPTTAAEVPQTIENLKIKKEWFMANQEKQTAANKAKAEKDVEALLRSIHSNGQTADPSGALPLESPNGDETPIAA